MKLTRPKNRDIPARGNPTKETQGEESENKDKGVTPNERSRTVTQDLAEMLKKVWDGLRSCWKSG